MRRGDFFCLAAAGLSAAAEPLLGQDGANAEHHLVSLSFDDGFRKSFVRTAEIYEKFGLPACFNVTAAGHRPEVGIKDDYVSPGQIGDFTLWNELAARGHEIMPHGYRHAHKDRLPFEEATSLISGCLTVFENELKGFRASRAVFNFPYNDITPQISAWLRGRVLAWRCHGPMINPLPHRGLVEIGAGGFGPGNAEAHLDRQIKESLSRESGWPVYNLHGLDDEGWGPAGSAYLEKLLDRLVKIKSVKIAPTARAHWEAGA